MMMMKIMKKKTNMMKESSVSSLSPLQHRNEIRMPRYVSSVSQGCLDSPR